MTTSPTAVSSGDPAAGTRVAALYDEHARTVLGLCRFLLRDLVEAEDAAQQTFLSAYRGLLGGAVPREPAAWLAAIARNECWSRIRRRMREPLALHEPSRELADPFDAVARGADLAALKAGLQGLSRPQREAFLLREFAGLSYAELAAALGISEPAADSLLFRARAGLRRALESANALLVPVALRDQLTRVIPGFDQPATGNLAKLVSLPFAAKLAAAGAGAVLVAAGSVSLEQHAAGPPQPAVAPVLHDRPTPARSRPQASAGAQRHAGAAIAGLAARPRGVTTSHEFVARVRVVATSRAARSGESSGRTDDRSGGAPTASSGEHSDGAAAGDQAASGAVAVSSDSSDVGSAPTGDATETQTGSSIPGAFGSDLSSSDGSGSGSGSDGSGSTEGSDGAGASSGDALSFDSADSGGGGDSSSSNGEPLS